MTPVSLGNCNYIETKHSKHTEIIKDPGLSIAEFINVYRTVTLTLSLSLSFSVSFSLSASLTPFALFLPKPPPKIFTLSVSVSPVQHEEAENDISVFYN